MKIKIGNKIYDSSEEPILIIFEDDDERKKHALIFLNTPDKEGVRKYCVFPDTIPIDEIKEFMKL